MGDMNARKASSITMGTPMTQNGDNFERSDILVSFHSFDYYFNPFIKLRKKKINETKNRTNKKKKKKKGGPSLFTSNFV
jgi:hypothetical protein